MHNYNVIVIQSTAASLHVVDMSSLKLLSSPLQQHQIVDIHGSADDKIFYILTQKNQILTAQVETQRNEVGHLLNTFFFSFFE